MDKFLYQIHNLLNQITDTIAYQGRHCPSHKVALFLASPKTEARKKYRYGTWTKWIHFNDNHVELHFSLHYDFNFIFLH